MSINQQIKPITTKTNDNNLYIGGCNCVELAREYKTPLYVIDEATLRGICREFKQAFKNAPNIKMMYACKALCNSAIVSILNEEGFGFDTVSAGEFHTIKNANINMNNVLFNGNNKSKEEIELAIKYGVGRFSTDNFYEAELLNSLAQKNNINAQILLRITPGIECHTHEYIKTGQIDSKFGFDLTQINEIVSLIKNQYHNLTLKGFHAHIGSQIFDLQSYSDEIDILMQEYLRVKKEFNLDLDELNIGGGVGVKYIETDTPPSIQDFADIVLRSIEKYTDDLPTIYIEPGRSIISTSGVTLYTVGSSKQVPKGRKYVAVDGGMADNPRPCMYNALYTADVVNKMDNEETEIVTIAGRYCESGDILIENINLPKVEPDDVICVYNTGAYNYSMASNYNRTEKPAMVLVNNSQSDIIVYREDLTSLVERDSIPNRLKK